LILLFIYFNYFWYIIQAELYDPKVVTREKIKALEQTNMIDMIDDEYKRYPDDASFQATYQVQQPILDVRRNEVFDKIDNAPEQVQSVIAFFDNNLLIEELKATPANFTLEHISAHQGITADLLEKYYRFAKFRYECGMYSDAETMLGNYLSVVQTQNSSVIGALWGRLACRILQAHWNSALSDLVAVKETVEVRNVAPIDQLRQRAWLLHWALFVYINQDDGINALVDFITEKAYLQTMENLCPWLLRYYTAFVILSPNRRKTMLRDLLNEIQSMNYQYSDPITEFLSSLYNQFDFDEAQQKLKECQELVKADFFLQIYADQFVHEARVMICEMYCAINRRVDLQMLAEKLQLTEEEAERWMVDMVRGSTSGSTTLDAKIDSSAKQVIMATPSRTAHQLVVDRTRDLTVRSVVLSTNLVQLASEQAVFIKNRYN
jgi:translation initiation factor 3 subunit E